MSIQEHLTDEQIIRAAVDLADLSPRQREHLSGCERCRGELASLGADLMGFGRLAASSVAVPARSFRLPDAVPGRAPARVSLWARMQNWWGNGSAFRLSGGLVMAAALVLAVMIGMRDPRPQPLKSLAAQDQELEFILAVGRDDEGTMEILEPPQSPPSAFVKFVVGMEDDEVNEEFMEFLAPGDDGEITGLL